MTFTNPAYLWALTGLAVPLAIHLLSRKEGRVIRVGSLRHVEESNTSQFKSIRLNEILLWLLRSLMVIFVVMFLSGASCTSPAGGNQSKWLVIENGVDSDPTYKQRIDSLVSNGYELHYLSENFPKEAVTANGHYRELVEELSKLPHDVIVISWSKVNGFGGYRTSLPPNVRWISADVVNKNYLATAWSAGDSVMTRTASTDANGTTYMSGFNNVSGDSIKVVSPAKIRISVSSDNNHRSESDILIAALKVIKSEYHLPLEIVNGDSDWVFWFRDAKPKFDGEKQVAFVSDNNTELVQRVSNNVTHIKRLTQDVALNENLVSGLLHLLYPMQQVYTVADSKDDRSLPEPIAWSSKGGTDLKSADAIQSDLAKYFIGLLVLTMALERFVAIRRNQ